MDLVTTGSRDNVRDEGCSPLPHKVQFSGWHEVSPVDRMPVIKAPAAMNEVKCLIVLLFKRLIKAICPGTVGTANVGPVSDIKKSESYIFHFA